VLQEGEFEKVGDEMTRRVNVGVFPLEVPPLRDRREDIPEPAAHFVRRACQRFHVPAPRFTERELERARQHDWPGNVRELQNVIERAVIVAAGGPLVLDLPQSKAPVSATPLSQDVIPEAEWRRREVANLRAALEQAKQRISGPGGAGRKEPYYHPSVVSLLLPALTLAQTLTEYHLPPDKLQQAEALYQTRVAIYVIGSLYGIAVIALLLVSGAGGKFRDWAEAYSHRRFLQAGMFAPLLLLSLDLLNVPVSIYSHHLQLTYGLSIQSWASWLGDWLKGECLTILLATLLIGGLYTLLRRYPRRWWLYGWFASIPVTVLLVFIQPVFVDPLFNEFAPLAEKQPQLIPELEKVIRRGGLTIGRDRMFEMKASDKVTTYNAYVTGIGASKRVVVWDTTSKDLTIPETMFVFGHEQGHYVLNHIWQGIGLSIAGLLVAFYLADRLMHALITHWGARLRIRNLQDWASFPLFLLLFSLFSLAGQPIASFCSRSMEHQADVYALEMIHGLVPDAAQVAARTEQKLGEKSLSYPYPDPLFVFWTYSHPPTADRLRFAARYRPAK